MHDRLQPPPQRPRPPFAAAAWVCAAGGVRAAAMLTVVVTLLPAGPCAPALAAEPRLDPGPYPYLVVDQDIKGVLVEFGRNVGVPVDVSDLVRGRMRGQHTAGSAREFLDGLCETYGLVWYFDGSVLHVNVKSEVRTELVDIGRVSLMEALDKLASLGVSDSRFPITRTDDIGVVSISGPPPFLHLARQTLTALARRPRDDDDEINIRVFRGGTTQVPDRPPPRARSKG